MNIAIYRIHYGLDFLDASIKSIREHVDRIYIFYSNRAWVNKPTVNYLGETMAMLEPPENVLAHLEKKYKFDLKVKYANHECSTPKNQFANLYEEAVSLEGCNPASVLFIEPDMIFTGHHIKDLYKTMRYANIDCLSSNQVEIWRLHENNIYRIPYRNRLGATLWNTRKNPDIKTHFGTYDLEKQNVLDECFNYNLAFCFNARTMLYKHLTAIQFSEEIGDSIPSQSWYRDKWLAWTPETTDLEIAERWKHLIHEAVIDNSVPYEIRNLL